VVFSIRATLRGHRQRLPAAKLVYGVLAEGRVIAFREVGGLRHRYERRAA
jgi:hypothetical protein